MVWNSCSSAGWAFRRFNRVRKSMASGFEAFDLAETRIRLASGLLGVGALVVEFRFDVEAS